MGEAYRGLTIQFKADGTKVLSTLKSMTRAASNVESELRMVKRALKFDAGSTAAAQAQLKLMGERAATAATTAVRLRRTLKEMGDTEVGGKKMKELSASTRDAVTKASLLKTRYSEATSALAAQYTTLKKICSETKGLKRLASVFNGKDFAGHNLEDVLATIDKMGAKLGWSKEKTDSWKTSIKALRTEFDLAGKEYKQMTDIAGYQSMTYKLAEEAAKQKAYVREMVAASRQLRATGFDVKLEGARAEMQRLETQAKELRAAMRLDPSSFQLAAAHAQALKGKISMLEAETRDLKAEMASLGSTAGVRELASDMSRLHAETSKNEAAMEKLQGDLVEMKGKANVAQEEIDQLANTLRKLGFTDNQIQLDDNFRQANVQLHEMNAIIDTTQKEYDVLTEKAQLYARAVRYGEDANRVAMNQAAIASTQRTLARGSKAKFFSSSAATAVGMQMYSTLYPAVMMGGQYAITAANDIDAAYRDMRKTVQGTEQDFEALKQAALEFGNTHYTSADDILEIEAMGGQLGIEVENLEAFSKVVSDLSIATDEAFTTDDVALWLGKMSNIMHINAEEYDNFADAMVRLGNSEPALESDIANITSRFAGMASIVGMAPDEILAIATAATATGQKAESAGGSLMRTLGRIESATAGVTEGMRNLDDMTEEDIAEFEAAKDNLQGYADVAGMTAEQFSSSWEMDPTATFQKFIVGLRRIKEEGGSVENILHEGLGIGSIRDRQLLSGLTQTVDVLDESLGMAKNAYLGISDEFGTAGDAAREADNKSQGFSGTLQIMKNNAQNLGATMAESLTPVLKDLTGMFSSLVGWFNQLDSSTQTMLTSTLLALAGLGPALTGIGAFGNLFGSLASSVRQYNTAENKLARVQGSGLNRMTGMAYAYSNMGANVDSLTKKLDRSRSTLNAVTKMQSKHIAATGMENKGIAQSIAIAQKQVDIDEKNLAKQKARNIGTRIGAGAMNLLGGVGQMALFGVAAFGIEQVATSVYDAWQKSENYRKSTEGLRDVIDRMAKSTDVASLGAGEYAKSLGDGTHAVNELKDSYHEMTAQNAQLADSFTKTLDAAEDSAVSAQFYADKILDLSGKVDGDEAKLAQLKAAIKEYNRITGQSIDIVDDYTGRLNQNTDSIEKNLEAFKERSMANAYLKVAEQSLEAQAAATVEYEKQGRALDELYAKQQELEKSGAIKRAQPGEEGAYTDRFGNAWVGDTMSVQQIDFESAELEKLQGETRKQKEAAEESAQVAYDMYNAQQDVANAASEEAKSIDAAASSIESYNNALENNSLKDDTSFEQMAASLNIAEDQLEGFAGQLSSVGIGADTLASVGTQQFARLYKQAVDTGGSIVDVRNAINLANNTGIDPKKLSVDGSDIKVNIDELSELDKKNLADKGFQVSDDGTIETAKQKLSELDAARANPVLNVIDNASSVIGNVLSMLSRVKDKTTTITTNHKDNYSSSTSTGQMATGGITRVPIDIPRHADGGISGIAKRATLTNIGWVGEAGAEAIIPLSNRRYVRPFARAVASEMGGGGQAQVSNTTMNVYLDGKFVAGGVDESTTLGELARGLRAKARA